MADVEHEVASTKVVENSETSTVVHLDYCLDDGKWAGLLFQEMALFRRPTYGTPSSEGARPNNQDTLRQQCPSPPRAT